MAIGILETFFCEVEVHRRAEKNFFRWFSSPWKVQPCPGHAGVLKVGATTIDVIMVRVDDSASGKIWLISKDTVASIPQLYAQMEDEGATFVERMVPAALTNRRLLDMSLAQWLGWLLSIQISWFLAWLLEILLSAPRRIWCKVRKLSFSSIWKTPLGMPLGVSSRSWCMAFWSTCLIRRFCIASTTLAFSRPSRSDVLRGS